MMVLREWLGRKTILGAALLASICGTGFSQGPGDRDYECFPSCSETDSRMLSLAGFTYSSIAGFFIQVRITVAPATEALEIGIFDGDTGKDRDGFLNPGAGHWDDGTHELEYALFADPRGDGSDLQLVATWGGNRDNPTQGAGWTASAPEMPDNDWWTVWLTPPDSGFHSKFPSAYLLRITNQDADVRVSSSFKLRTTGGLEVGTDGQPWGVQAAVTATGKPDARIVYPRWDGSFTLPRPDFFMTTETTYDGNWAFRFDVSHGQHEIRLYDGDFDFGSVGRPAVPSGGAVQWCADQADPDSIGLPDFAIGTLAYPDRVGPAGHPADDNKLDFYRRPPCVRYALVDPDGTVYRNANPSSEQEWEQFVVSSRPNDSRSEADYAPRVSSDGVVYVPRGSLRTGEWKLVVEGLDLGNTIYFSGPTIKGGPSASLAGGVWLDANGDGARQAEEPGLEGAEVWLFQDDGDGVLTPSPQPGPPPAGLDKWIARQRTGSDGGYRFAGLGAGRFFVVLAQEALSPDAAARRDPCRLGEGEQGRGPDIASAAQ